MNITFVDTRVIKALGELSAGKMHAATLSAAANLWLWGLHRQSTGQRCELRFYARQTGISRNTLTSWMKQLEAAGVAERSGHLWRCIPIQVAQTSSQDELQVAQTSSQGWPKPRAQVAQTSGPSKTPKTTAKREEGTTSSSPKREMIDQIVFLWNREKPERWAAMEDLQDTRLKNLEALGYKGVAGLQRFLDELPFILRGVKADPWWAEKDMTFSTLTRKTTTRCIDWLEKGKQLASADQRANPNKVGMFSMGRHPSWDPGPVNRPHELICTGSFATEEEREASRLEALAHYKLTDPSND